MGKKVSLIVITLIFAFAVCNGAVFGAEYNNPAQSSEAPQINKQVNLTDAQKKELKQIYDKVFEYRKQVVQKYLEFGVITKEQADKKINKINEMQKKMEQNGYMPGYGKDKKDHGKYKDGKQSGIDSLQTVTVN